MIRLRRSPAGPHVLEGELEATVLRDANRFLESTAVRGLSLATQRAYGFDLVTLLRWLEPTAPLADLTEDRLLEFIAHQQRAGAQPASINRRLVTGALFYRFVIGHDLPPTRQLPTAGHFRGRGRDHALGLHRLHRRRPCRLRVKAPRKLVEPLAVDEVRAFLHTLRRYRDLAMTYLMLFCGLRASEVLALTLADVDHLERRLHITGKGQRDRVLPLPEILAATLADYLRWERPTIAATDQLFVVLKGPHRGRALTRAGLRRLFRHRRRTTALRRAHPHRFRHTFGADMARAGVRLALLQRLMGHADGKTTLQYIQLSLADVADQYRQAMTVIGRRYEVGP